MLFSLMALFTVIVLISPEGLRLGRNGGFCSFSSPLQLAQIAWFQQVLQLCLTKYTGQQISHLWVLLHQQSLIRSKVVSLYAQQIKSC
jgi:hypothetical protein